MRTKKLILALWVAGGALTASASVKYNITGKTSQDMDGKMVYLYLNGQQNRLPQDSVKIANGSFIFEGESGGVDIATIYTQREEGRKGIYCLVGIEPTPVNIDFTTQSDPVLKGGVLNSALNEYTDSMAVYSTMQEDLQMDKLIVEYRDSLTTKERRQEIVNLYNKVDKGREEAMKRLLQKNRDNVLGAFILLNLRNSYTDEEFEKLVLKLGNEFQEYAPLKRMITQVNAAKVRRIGNKYIDFEQSDANGKMHKLSEYIGVAKYVLVDFWASWCGPCRAEVPNVKAAYDKFHTKGFEVVGVSLDDKKEAWLKAVEQLKMNWPQLSDLQGWKNVAARKYGVNGIPCTLLLDSNGVIIGADYRGDQLINKLGELLK